MISCLVEGGERVCVSVNEDGNIWRLGKQTNSNKIIINQIMGMDGEWRGGKRRKGCEYQWS